MDKLNISVAAGEKILHGTTNAIASKVDDIVDEINKPWKCMNAFLVGSTAASISIHTNMTTDSEGVTRKVSFTDYAYLGLGSSVRYFNKSFEVTTKSTNASSLWKLLVNKQVVWNSFSLGDYGAFTPNANMFALTYYSDNSYPMDIWEPVIIFQKDNKVFKEPYGLYTHSSE